MTQILIQRWYWFWLTLAYALRLRGLANRLQRRLVGEHDAPRAPLPTFDTPEELAAYIDRHFEWRRDSGRLGGIVFPLDWVSCPEVFQHRLERGDVGSGDCDDVHYWAAVGLHAMDGVSDVYLLSNGYQGGGHTTCVYRYAGRWWHLDYEIRRLPDPAWAPHAVAERYSDDGSDFVPWYVFEHIEPRWRAAAIGPSGSIT